MNPLIDGQSGGSHPPLAFALNHLPATIPHSQASASALKGTVVPLSVDVDSRPPRDEYLRRLEARRARAADRERTQAISGISRFAVAILGFALLVVIFALKWLSPAWLAVPVVVFLAALSLLASKRSTRFPHFALVGPSPITSMASLASMVAGSRSATAASQLSQ